MRSPIRAATHGFTLAALVVCLAPGTATAVPPENDAYLDSIRVNEPDTRLPRRGVRDIRSTIEATTQADLFSPPTFGGGAEPTVCDGDVYGKTIWYDFFPELPGDAEIQSAGFDAVITVYEFNPTTNELGRPIRCTSVAGVTEDLFVGVKAGRAYTAQIGGVVTPAGPAAGDLQFSFEFFADRDRDGEYDVLDDCPRIAGQGSSGCPPKVSASVKLRARATAAGIQVLSLSVTAPRGARVVLRCRRRCGARESRRAGRRGVSLRALRGVALPAGATFDVSVTEPRSIGRHFRYRVARGDVSRTERCLLPGAVRPRRCA